MSWKIIIFYETINLNINATLSRIALCINCNMQNKFCLDRICYTHFFPSIEVYFHHSSNFRKQKLNTDEFPSETNHLLDNSSAKHKLAVKPKKNHLSSHHRGVSPQPNRVGHDKVKK
jgi:hypothetical protein